MNKTNERLRKRGTEHDEMSRDLVDTVGTSLLRGTYLNWNSSPDAADADGGGRGAGLAWTVFAQSGIHQWIQPIHRIRCQQLQDGPSPTHAQYGQDDVSLNKLPQRSLPMPMWGSEGTPCNEQDKREAPQTRH